MAICVISATGWIVPRLFDAWVSAASFVALKSPTSVLVCPLICVVESDAIWVGVSTAILPDPGRARRREPD